VLRHVGVTWPSSGGPGIARPGFEAWVGWSLGGASEIDLTWFCDVSSEIHCIAV